MSLAQKFDQLVIGAGSGGIGCARRAAMFGKSVCVIEHKRLGGTCVNVGCVPKKIMCNQASMIEDIHRQQSKGALKVEGLTADWGHIKTLRDNYILFLNNIYKTNLGKDNVKIVSGFAKFVSKNEVRVGEETFTSDNILIATGGYPIMPETEGIEHAKHSDHFFDLEIQPKSVQMLGSGYIAVELAGIFQGFGTDVTQVVRRDRCFTNFDVETATKVTACFEKNGLKIKKNSGLKKIELMENGMKKCTLSDDSTLEVEEVFIAIGRAPDTNRFDIENCGVKLDKQGFVEVDEFSNTNVPGIYAIGDCIGKIALTPVAIREGRILSERLFNGQTTLKMDYDMVPSVIFSHPPYAACGLTQEEAEKKYGKENIGVNTSNFRNMYYALCDESVKQPSFMKIVTLKSENERVIGAHMFGMGVDEMMQTMAVAMKMGCTKLQLDAAVAIHPTASEELVLLPAHKLY